MRLTRPLRPSPPRFPLDVHPLARLEGGRLELLTPAFPPEGPLMLALWTPGGDPAFRLATGSLGPGRRWSGPETGWVVAWEGAPAEGS